MHKYLLIPLAIFAVGCCGDVEEKRPTHKLEAYLLNLNPVHFLQIEDVDKLEGKWWDTNRKDGEYGHRDLKLVMPTEMFNTLQENKYYVFWYYNENGRKHITSARMPIEINRKLKEKRDNYKEEVTVQKGE